MIGNRHSGDDIAADFLRLIKKSASQESPLETHSSDVAPVENNNAKDKKNPKDYLVRNNAKDSSHMISDLENKIDDFGGDGATGVSSSPVMVSAKRSEKKGIGGVKNVRAKLGALSPDGRTLRILNGLGKIAGSLRSKGEGFAADVVEATAMSVKSESLEDAKRKAFVLSELDKISSDLKDENNIFASDLVLATANKILKY